MAEVKKYPDIDPPPDPPAVVTKSYLGFAALGALHLTLAALFPECLQLLNLILGLVEILIAIVIGIKSSDWSKKYDEWVANNLGSQPESPTDDV